MQLREYQTTGIELIRAAFRRGTKKVLLWLATGGGKTVVFCFILKGVSDSGGNAIMIVRGRKLVDQASVRLTREGVHHGVLMANHWNYRPNARIQVCSIDTLKRRGLFPKASLVVIDEGHLFTSTSDKEYFAEYERRGAFFLPVTATPFTEKSMEHIAQEIVNPISIKELIAQGHLVPARTYAPHIPDLSHVTIKKGDYDKVKLQEVMQESELVADIINTYRTIGENRSAILFAVSIAHSEFLTDKFNQAGIPALHCDANSSDKERNDAVNKLETGEIKIICNVGIFGIGVDIPFLGAVILARPTKSLNLYIQQAGRGTRPFAGKTDFLLLDHAGNCIRHGLIDQDRVANLKGKLKAKKKLDEAPKICKVCFMAFMGTDCPMCGPAQCADKCHREFAELDGELKEITDLDPVKLFIGKTELTAKQKGYKKGWVVHKVAERFGWDVAEIHFPKSRAVKWKQWTNSGVLKI